MEQTRPAVPVSAQSGIDVAADERIVWAIIADIAAWPTWNPSLRQVTIDGEIEAGAAFHYSSALGSVSCQLSRVDAPRELAWRGRLWTMTLQQACRIEPGAVGSHVSVNASLSGVIARVFRRRLRPRLQDDLDSMLDLLRLEAEVRSSEGRDEAAATAVTAAAAAGEESHG